MHHTQDGRKGRNSDDRIAINVIIDALDSISMFVPWTPRSGPPLAFICSDHSLHVSAKGVDHTPYSSRAQYKYECAVY